MKLLALSIRGFRGVQEADLHFGQHDVLVGPNGAGKSTIIDALSLVFGRTRLVLRHVLPNIVATVIIIFSINIGGVIISEASLSFLGFGLPAQIPSWGGMLSRGGREYMEMAPWLALFPGLALTITVYSFKMFGNALRDLLDPRLRGGGGGLGAGAARSA